MVKIKIFDVEHGQCALVEADSEHMLIDCGHNSSTDWRPSKMLRYRGIDHLDALVITNADEDHASDLENVLDVASVCLVFSNPTLGVTDILRLKGQSRCGRGIRRLTTLLDSLQRPAANRLAPSLGGVQMSFFWNDYPRHFVDENNLSLVAVLAWPGLTICFPGDMEKAGWLRLLQDPQFRTAMANVDILVASHHGRANGFSESLFARTGLAPQLVIISDSGIEHATQETVASYGQRTRGIWFGDKLRKVLTTRSDGRIEICSTSNGWTVNTLTT